MPHVPRSYQSDAIASLRVNFARGIRKQLLVAPTGAGKTTIAAIVIDGAMRKAKRTWFLAHRRELINQCSARLDDHGIGHGVIQAKHPRFKPQDRVQVVSVHTIVRGNRLQAVNNDGDAPDLIIIDEAHRSLAQSYMDVTDAFPQAAVIGLTATPWRLDGKPLGDRYEELVLVATPQQLIDLGFLLAPRVYAPSQPDLTGIRKVGGDYKNDELGEKMRDATIVGDVVEHWKRHVQPSPNPLTVLFAVNKAHSNVMRDRFRQDGIAAAHIDESSTVRERDEVLRDLSTGVVKVVCNCQILTEGWDLPQLGCVELLRPTMSLALYLQMAGRGMRPFEGKDSWLLMDHAGCVLEHGFPQQDREYSLDKPAEKRVRGKSESGPPVTVCEKCFAIYESALKMCSECGFVRPVQEREIKEDREDVLGELTPKQLEERRKKQARKIPWSSRRATLVRHLSKAAQLDNHDGWASYKFKEEIGAWPPHKMQEEARAIAAKVSPHYKQREDGVLAVQRAFRALGVEIERRTSEPDVAADHEGGARGAGLSSERSEAPGSNGSMDSVRRAGSNGSLGDRNAGGLVFRDRDEAGEGEAPRQEGD